MPVLGQTSAARCLMSLAATLRWCSALAALKRLLQKNFCRSGIAWEQSCCCRNEACSACTKHDSRMQAEAKEAWEMESNIVQQAAELAGKDRYWQKACLHTCAWESDADEGTKHTPTSCTSNSLSARFICRSRRSCSKIRTAELPT